MQLFNLCVAWHYSGEAIKATGVPPTKAALRKAFTPLKTVRAAQQLPTSATKTAAQTECAGAMHPVNFRARAMRIKQ
jgi:hypothetical protein